MSYEFGDLNYIGRDMFIYLTNQIQRDYGSTCEIHRISNGQISTINEIILNLEALMVHQLLEGFTWDF